MPKLSIIIVNWNCRDYIKPCLDSVFAQTLQDREVIVIDNASLDDSVACLKKWYPGIRIVQNNANLGYTKAQNQGIRMTDSQFFMSLNPDVKLMPDYCELLIERLETQERIGYGIGKVMRMSRSLEPLQTIFSAGHLFPRNRFAYNRGIDDADAPIYNREEEIPGANGSSLIYKRAMLDDIRIDNEYLDEDFFMYYDDLDIDWRAHLRGWKCWYAPQCVAYHIGEGTGALAKPSMLAKFLINRQLSITKNDSISDFLLNLPYILKGEVREVWKFLFSSPVVPWYVFWGTLRRLPRAIRKRFLIQKRRTASRADIHEWFALSLRLLEEANQYRKSTG